MRFIFSLSVLLSACTLFAQNHHERFESIDVIHYVFEIHLNDSTDRIEGNSMVLINFLKPVKSFTLDLVGIDSTNTGMIVESVKVGSYFRNFIHKNNQLNIEITGSDFRDTVNVVECNIKYSGVPADGLVISKNKYGDRTFFGDNWPDRAKHWLPTVDHPSDKSTLHFVVYAPVHYQVVSNGSLKEVTNLGNGFKKTVWHENVPISTKLMVIGVADFAVGNKETFNNIPVSSWVFPQNKEKGFENYKFGLQALKYFSELIGSYSYEKLAHVQSKTRYGGMENAGCIFYHENSGFSDSSQERLFAHETAHQWFGNSVSEQNWHHIWLSEGFATYLTNVYNQDSHGEKLFRNGLKKDRERVIKYAGKNLAPIIDTTVTNYIQLLNTNSYQKASWVLHMLRENLGDSIFFAGLQKYYNDFKNSTALTKNFMNVMESVSGKELDPFFHQWLWQTGHPKLKIDWKQKSNKKLKLEIIQTQTETLFSFPIEIEIRYKNGDRFIQNVKIVDRISSLSFPIKNDIESVFLDPNVKLLFEEVQ